MYLFIIKFMYCYYNKCWSRSRFIVCKTALWYILKKASTAYYSRNPSIEVGDNYVRSSTDSIYFNQGDTGAAGKVSVSLPWSRMAVDVHVSSDALNWLDKISIILTTPDGKRDVINKSISRGQLASYDSASPYGTYQLRFVENDASKWTCYYTLYDFNYVPRSSVRKAVTAEGDMVEYIITEDNTKIYTIRSNYRDNILEPFNDNLTNQYQANDIIRLKFKVVEEYSSNGYIFENIDYIYDEINLESGYPNISDYLW